MQCRATRVVSFDGIVSVVSSVTTISIRRVGGRRGAYKSTTTARPIVIMIVWATPWGSVVGHGQDGAVVGVEETIQG